MGEPTRRRLPAAASEPTFRLRLIPGGAETGATQLIAPNSGPAPTPPVAAPPTRTLTEGMPATSTAPPPASRLSAPPTDTLRPPGSRMSAEPSVQSRASALPAMPPHAAPPLPVTTSSLLSPPPLPAGALTVDATLATLIPEDLARVLRCFPFHREGGWLWIASDSASRETLAEAIAEQTGLGTVVGEAPAAVVDAVLDFLYHSSTGAEVRLQVESLDGGDLTVHRPRGWAGYETSNAIHDRVGEILALTGQVASEAKAEAEPVESTPDSHAARLVEEMLRLALEVGASDVHLEPEDGRVQVRVRIDGLLQPLVELPHAVLPRMLGRLKVLAAMNLVEKRLPQEARFRYLQDRGHRVDIRVSTMPVVHGEGVVMRLLDNANLRVRVDDLGLEGADRDRVRRCLRGPRGLVLATGPTGSGKSTTLYTIATELNDHSRKIVTIEDPVEYHLDGLQQIQIHSQIGLTFERVIRSTLRQDPDVILVGEIRDGETAQAAVKAALTGHLVLSSLHTADAAGAIARLVDLGVEPGMCAAALRLVVGQRLVRTLCANCRRPVSADQVHALLGMAGIDPTIAEMSMRPVGCLECRSLGYRGRRAVFEVLEMSPRLRRLVQNAASPEVVQAAAVEEGMTSLADAALALVREGETSVEEALRVVWLD